MSERTEDGISSAVWPPAMIFYAHAILFNTRAALESLEIACEAMGLIEGSQAPERIEQDFVLNHMQNAVIHAGAISRHFWPTKGKGAAARKAGARGAYLRRRYGVTDNSPLADRRLRNAIEHFDERLDAYVENGIVGYIVPHYVGPSLEPSEVPGHIFRAFYTDELVFEVIGERYTIPPLIDELEWLEERIGALN